MQQQQVIPFRAGTQRQQFLLPTQQSTAFGDRKTFSLFPAGWLASIDLPFNATLATGAGTPAGGFAVYPPLPWSLIRQIRVYSNTQAEMINASSWGLYLHNLTSGILNDANKQVLSDLNTNNIQLLTRNTAPATAAASATYNEAGFLRIPIQTDNLFQRGLLYLQDQSTLVSMDVSTGQASEVSNVTGVTVTPTINLRPSQHCYLVRPDTAPPNTDWTREIREVVYPLTNTGDFVINLVPGPVYIKVLGIVENNGAQIAPSVATPIINSLVWSYAQANVFINESYDQHLVKNYERLSQVLPDGMFCYDFADGFGLPGAVQTDTMNFFDTSDMTNVSLKLNISGIALVNAQVRVIYDMLVPRR